MEVNTHLWEREAIRACRVHGVYSFCLQSRTLLFHHQDIYVPYCMHVAQQMEHAEQKPIDCKFVQRLQVSSMLHDDLASYR